MPSAPMRPCAQPGCSALVQGGRCVAHGGTGQVYRGHRWDTDRRTEVPRVRGRALQAKRRQLFAREPLCRTCASEGRTTLAAIRDHVIPLEEGGSDADENIQPLCQTCSDAKTHKESVRGHRRAR